MPGDSGDGGSALNAELNNPQGLAIDSLGNLYIADSNNNRVRVVSRGVDLPSPAMGTSAPATVPPIKRRRPRHHWRACTCRWAWPCNSNGNVYIADTADNIIRKVTTDGIINRVAGDSYPGFGAMPAGPMNAELQRPGDVTVDSTGNVYIADTEMPRSARSPPPGSSTPSQAIGPAAGPVTAARQPARP